TPAAAAERAAQIGAELTGSFTLGAGQFCTKPGLVFVPGGADGDEVVAAMAQAITASAPQVLLNDGIADSFGRRSSQLAGVPGVRAVAHGTAEADGIGEGGF